MSFSFRKNKPASTGRGSPSASLPTGNNPSGEPAAAPDGRRSLRKQLLEVFTPRSKSKSQTSSPLSGTSPAVSVANLTALEEVAADGLVQALRIAKESADWNPFLKGALGGVVAVVDLVKELQQVSDNWQEMEAVLNRIISLLPIVHDLREHLQVCSPDIKKEMNYISKCADVMQNEFKTIQEMQSHGLIRRGLQATSDARVLLGACKKITEAFDDLKLAVMIIIEQDTHLILKNIMLRDLKTSETAAHTADIDSNHVSRRSCTEGTRHEVLKGIFDWLHDSNSPAVYWLTGAAGMGKTTIAKTVCEKITRQPNSSNEAVSFRQPLVSFFCSHQLDSGKSGLLLPTICRRLCDHSSSYAAAVVAALEQDSELASATLNVQLEQLLIQPWKANAAKRQGLPCPLIVVDALDENPRGFDLLKGLLKAVEAKRLEGLKFFITSRTDPEISALCATFPPDAVCFLQNISRNSTQNDIRLYLKESLPSVESALLEKLTEGANGLFIYAATVVNLVIGQNGSTVDEQAMVLEKILSQTSDSDVSMGLNQLYNQILWLNWLKQQN
ncbi:hypothetical protein C0995_011538 [Termitomyces sp. Mi166|nr:hypothetical protein C0995_011538 [Termitomyces sp. Mi166\